MPAIKCQCGKRLSYGEMPSEIEWLIISDEKYDAFEGKIDAEILYKEMQSMIKCSDCGRIYIFWNGYQEPPECYLKSKDYIDNKSLQET